MVLAGRTFLRARSVEMDVGLDGLEEFGFEKHLLEVEALEGVLLHELDDGGGEISADIAEPAGDVGIGGAKAAGAIWTT